MSIVTYGSEHWHAEICHHSVVVEIEIIANGDKLVELKQRCDGELTNICQTSHVLKVVELLGIVRTALLSAKTAYLHAFQKRTAAHRESTANGTKRGELHKSQHIIVAQCETSTHTVIGGKR